MRTIHKFELGMATVLDIGDEAEVLHIAEQHGRLTMWVAYVGDKQHQSRKFAVYPTGTETLPEPDVAQHMGTVLMSDGLVWHVFEIVL